MSWAPSPDFVQKIFLLGPKRPRERWFYWDICYILLATVCGGIPHAMFWIELTNHFIPPWIVTPGEAHSGWPRTRRHGGRGASDGTTGGDNFWTTDEPRRRRESGWRGPEETRKGRKEGIWLFGPPVCTPPPGNTFLENIALLNKEEFIFLIAIVETCSF